MTARNMLNQQGRLLRDKPGRAQEYRRSGDQLELSRNNGTTRLEHRVQALFACANQIHLSRRLGKLYFLDGLG